MKYRTGHRTTAVTSAYRKIQATAPSADCVTVGTVARPESRYANSGR